ncbi:hypothetical protein EVAR_98098_1 [Eumeta japonica]|uniref:Ig-like domain-containing protein n=1 Tax=Eumeta variegata TaxID=151549 RepID=A0A4C1XJ13_EUMVA|nr:hypothetical protein EVAR_98098_1 [Eumeta japonica]
MLPSFIYWYRGPHVVNYAQRGGISVETEQRTRTSRLLIARASPRDSGNYTCAPSSSGVHSASTFHTVSDGGCGRRGPARPGADARTRVTRVAGEGHSISARSIERR